MKTNRRWYPYIELAGYCKLQNGELLFSPMFTTYEELFRVHRLDWKAIDDEEDRAYFKKIEAELQNRE